jgi:hypothetical protein
VAPRVEVMPRIRSTISAEVAVAAVLTLASVMLAWVLVPRVQPQALEVCRIFPSDF